jgi:endonuclease/exonuclease/phosphatase family metal-dependent hydrolase
MVVKITVYGVLLLACIGCRPGINYSDPVSPRYRGAPARVDAPLHNDMLKVVSFNIEYAKEMRGAAKLLSTVPALRDADIILLQEMTAPATRFLADSLHMRYVYYPAIYNRLKRQDIGNAILSRWPIVEDAKLILPSRSRYAKTQRIATAATIKVRGRNIRAYSTHLGTPADLGWDGRVLQLKRIIEDASAYSLVLIGGDMNNAKIGRIARDAGFTWPTEKIPKSNSFGRLDHFFVRGFDTAGSGTHRVPRSVSDHSPVWVRLNRTATTLH